MKTILFSLLLLGLFPSGNAQESAAAQAGARTTENLTLELVTKVDPGYPRALEGKHVSDEVLLKIEISESGNVETAQVISGDVLLANAAVIAVKQWKFKPFLQNGKPTKISILLPFSLAPRPMRNSQSIRVVPATKASATSPRPSELSTDSRSMDENAVRVDSVIMQAFVVDRSFPVYPTAARQAKVQGTVSLRVLIGQDGVVKHMEPISGPEQLVNGAIETVRQWKYRPFVLNDKPVDVETIVKVVYQMAG